MINEFIHILTFNGGYNSAIVVFGTAILGIAAGTIGNFAVLRKRALMGDALAHSTLPGLALAFIIGVFIGVPGKNLALLLFGATISGIIGVLCVQLIVRTTRLYEDTAVGIVLSCFFGAGVVLISVIQSMGSGEEGGLNNFIYGQTAAMNRGDVYTMLLIAVASIVLSSSLIKEFRLICFDRNFAEASGWPVSFIDLIMMFIVVCVTVVGLHAVGLLLIVALLIIPPSAARFWTENLNKMMIISALIGGLSGYLGASVSALLPHMPAGAVIVLVSGVMFFVSFLFAPCRGVVATIYKLIKLRFRIAEEHLLRSIYEEIEKLTEGEFVNKPVPIQKIKLIHSWIFPFQLLVLSSMKLQRLINIDKGEIFLLENGIVESTRKVRNHRLWEEYLLSHADIPISHVDYSADLVEHFISPELVRDLEKSLEEKGRRSLTQLPPTSIHPIESAEGKRIE